MAIFSAKKRFDAKLGTAANIHAPHNKKVLHLPSKVKEAAKKFGSKMCFPKRENTCTEPSGNRSPRSTHQGPRVGSKLKGMAHTFGRTMCFYQKKNISAEPVPQFLTPSSSSDGPCDMELNKLHVVSRADSRSSQEDRCTVSNVTGVDSVIVNFGEAQDNDDKWIVGVANPSASQSASTSKFPTPSTESSQEDQDTSLESIVDLLEQEISSDRVEIDSLIWGEKLGSGAMGTVFAASVPSGHSDTRYLHVNEVAIKCVELTQEKDEEAMEELLKEISIHQKISGHPGVATIFDALRGSHRTFMVIEMLRGGDLAEFVGRFGPMKQNMAMAVVAELMDGVAHLHENGVAHLDIKLENLMFSDRISKRGERSPMKMIDFGLCEQFENHADVHRKVCSKLCGSPGYTAPEVVLDEVYCASAADVWSCGAVLFCLLTGNLPFDVWSWDEYTPEMRHADKNILKMLPDDVCEDVKTFVFACLSGDPVMRPSAAEGSIWCRDSVQ